MLLIIVLENSISKSNSPDVEPLYRCQDLFQVKEAIAASYQEETTENLYPSTDTPVWNRRFGYIVGTVDSRDLRCILRVDLDSACSSFRMLNVNVGGRRNPLLNKGHVMAAAESYFGISNRTSVISPGEGLLEYGRTPPVAGAGVQGQNGGAVQS